MTCYIIVKAGAALVATLAAIAGILYQPDEGERSDAWSIRRRDARIFFPLLYLIWIGAGAALAWSQFAPEPSELLQRLTFPPHQGDGAAYIVLARFAGIFNMSWHWILAPSADANTAAPATHAAPTPASCTPS